MALRVGSFLRGAHIVRQRYRLRHTQASTSRDIKINTNGKEYMVDKIVLRDSCSCARCVDPSTKQKLFDTASIPFKVNAIQLVVHSDGSVSVSWENDIPGYGNHTSSYPQKLFSSNSRFESRKRALQNSFPHVLWNRKAVEKKVDPVDYASYMSSPATLHEALSRLQHYGLLFLSSVPSVPKSVEAIANRIGPLRHTLYGSTWDVQSVPAAKNIAYTSSHLGFHMDLLYHETPPKFQILHCMKASTTGGESLFSDTFHALEKMKLEEALIDSLSQFDVKYHYRNDGHWYQFTHKTIEYDPSRHLQQSHRLHLMRRRKKAQVKAVNWSPPFQAPFAEAIGIPQVAKARKPSVLSTYLQATKVFKGLIEDEEAVFETKMDPGTCVIFDNRRIVHARKAFEGEDSERWLRGAYIDEDGFKSRLRVLNEEFGVIMPKE